MLRERLALRRENGSAWLVRTDDGAFVILRDDGDDGPSGDVVDVRADGLGFREKLLGAELVAHGEVLQVPAGKVDEAKRLVAFGRAAPPGTTALDTGRKGRFLDGMNAAEARALGHLLDDDEVLLAWLESASEREVPSPLGAREASLYFLLTDRRQALLAVGALGDVLQLPLPARAIVVEKNTTRSVFHAADVEWHAPLLSEGRLSELVSLPALPAEARVLELVRLTLQERGAKEADVVTLLGWLCARRDPYGELTSWALGERLALEDAPGDERVRKALAALVAGEGSSAELLRWWRAFKLPLETGLELLARLFEDAAAREWAVELHAGLREAQLAAAADDVEQAAVDIVYAEHLLATARYGDAQVVLEARLAALPNEEVLDLLPPEDADLTEGAGGQRLRIRVLELLAAARGAGGPPDLDAVRSLAQLQPLAPDRVSALFGVAEGPLAEAARQVIALLAPGGLTPLDEDAAPALEGEVFALKKKALMERVRHPAVREGHALDKLQSFLASVEVPDHAALRSYSERLGAEHQAAWVALADACVAFGVKGVAAYISRGDKAVGIRAYDGAPPFLVIGGRHLEPGNDFRLHPRELRFTIASEVAHLRFQHARVTTSDVWSGALEKGRLGVDLVLGMIPVLRGVDLIDKVGKIIDHYKRGPIGRVVKGIDLADRTVTKVRKKAPKKPAPRRDKMVATTNDKLIAAHRVMQLTADRAGLLLAGDLRASLRAIFKSTHDYLAELPVVERHGVAKALSRRDDDGEILHQDLAVRVSSLISFYLSDDYRALRKKLTTPPARDPSA